jgi:hypothetical protein
MQLVRNTSHSERSCSQTDTRWIRESHAAGGVSQVSWIRERHAAGGVSQVELTEGKTQSSYNMAQSTCNPMLPHIIMHKFVLHLNILPLVKR